LATPAITVNKWYYRFVPLNRYRSKPIAHAWNKPVIVLSFIPFTLPLSCSCSPVACTINILRWSYDNCCKWCLYYKHAIALCKVMNYAPRVINYAARVMLQIVTSLLRSPRWLKYVYSKSHWLQKGCFQWGWAFCSRYFKRGKSEEILIIWPFLFVYIWCQL